MAMELGYDALRKVQIQERNYSSLSKVEDDFFDKYNAYSRELRSRLEKSFSIEAAKALENTERVLRDVFEQRKQKIFFKALRDVKNESIDSTGLARQEKQLYTSIITLLKSFDSVLFQPERQETTQMPAKPNSVEVEMLVDLPEIASVDSGSPIGPFKKGQKAEMSERQASLLAKRGAARILANKGEAT